MTSPASTVKSAKRVLEVLEFFAEWRRPASVKEVSVSLGYPLSSTSVLLSCLASEGYFDHDARTGMYVPNLRLTLATSWIQATMFSEHNMLRMMERLLDATGHTVMVGTQHGVHVRYLHVLQATRADRFLAKIGSLRPLFRSAAGRMLLSLRTERDIAVLLRKANAIEADVRNRVELSAILHDLMQVRRDGYAMSMGTSMPGAAALAVLIPVPRGYDPMTLSVGGPQREVAREKKSLVERLREAVEPIRRVVAA